MSQLVQYAPEKRMTAAQALAHPLVTASPIGKTLLRAKSIGTAASAAATHFTEPWLGAAAQGAPSLLVLYPEAWPRLFLERNLKVFSTLTWSSAGVAAHFTETGAAPPRRSGCAVLAAQMFGTDQLLSPLPSPDRCANGQ